MANSNDLKMNMEKFNKTMQTFKEQLNSWIAVEDELPRWYIPVLVLTDGDYKTNPFCDKVKVSGRYDLREYDWNNQFHCDKKVFYWAHLSDVPTGFNEQVKKYQLEKDIEKLQKEYADL